jgi:hypothetical protein
LSNWYEFYFDVSQQGQFTAHIQNLHTLYGVSRFLFAPPYSLTLLV